MKGAGEPCRGRTTFLTRIPRNLSVTSISYRRKRVGQGRAEWLKARDPWSVSAAEGGSPPCPGVFSPGPAGQKKFGCGPHFRRVHLAGFVEVVTSRPCCSNNRFLERGH